VVVNLGKARTSLESAGESDTWSREAEGLAAKKFVEFRDRAATAWGWQVRAPTIPIEKARPQLETARCVWRATVGKDLMAFGTLVSIV
jgi:hypothetical protein